MQQPQNIATTIQGVIDQLQVDMYEANIYINFSKNGVPIVFVDEKDYEKILISRELNPQKKYHPTMKLNFGKFIIDIEQKEYLLEENKTHLRFQEIIRIKKNRLFNRL